MGRSHAISAAVGWLGGCALLGAAGVDSGPAAWVGAAVSAGMALLPDLDHPESTASRTLGPITRTASSAVTWTARQSQHATCGHCRRDPNSGGHRGLTHTALGAVAMSVAVTAGSLWLERGFPLMVAALSVWLLAHTAFNARVRAKIGDLVLPGKFRHLGRVAHRFAGMVGAVLVAVLFAGAAQAQVGSWWWLGLAVGWGCLAHSLGDAMTYSRVPLLWPIRINGCRWARVGMPRALRFRTGSRTEKGVVVLMLAVGVLATAALGASS